MKINSISANCQTQTIQNKQNNNKPAFGAVFVSDLESQVPGIIDKIKEGLIVGNIAEKIKAANANEAMHFAPAIKFIGKAVDKFNDVLAQTGLADKWNVNLKNNKLVLESGKYQQPPKPLTISLSGGTVTDNPKRESEQRFSFDFLKINDASGQDLYASLKDAVSFTDGAAKDSFEGIENEVPSIFLKETPIFITEGDCHYITSGSKKLGDSKHTRMFSSVKQHVDTIKSEGDTLLHKLKAINEAQQKTAQTLKQEPKLIDTQGQEEPSSLSIAVNKRLNKILGY